MNQYQRMVSYLYQYHQGEKGENVGYVRVERKQQQCQIVIRMRPVSLEHMPEIRLFIQEPDGIVYVPAGNMSAGGNSLERKLITMSENVFQTNKPIDSFEGLLLYVSAKTYFATSWKNDRIFLGDMRTFNETESSEKSNSGNSKSQEDDNTTDNSATNQLTNESSDNNTSKEIYDTNSTHKNQGSYSKADNTSHNQRTHSNAINSPHNQETYGNAINSPNNQGGYSNTDNTPHNQGRHGNAHNSPHNQETYSNAYNIPPKQMEHGNLADSSKSSQPQPPSKDNSSEIHAAMVEGELTAAEENIVNMSLQNNLKQKSPETTQSTTYDETQKSASEVEMQSVCSICPFKRRTLDYGKRMLCTFPHMHPFPDGRIRECVRIEPQDIGCLPIRLWSLANNNFLLQGYFNYRHLLFLELKDGNYAIGVPGIFTQKENGTAHRFAFPQFMPLSNEENCNGAFGYWLQTLPRTLT